MIPARPIALIGMRCSGKSTTGRALADRLSWPFVDLDDEVLAAAERSGERAAGAGELLVRVGLALFREFEAAALRRLLEPGGRLVVATGGGVVEREDNRVWLARTSFRVWLRAPVEVLRERLESDGGGRPALLPGGDPATELGRLSRRRERHYAELADLVLDSDQAPPEMLAERILERLSSEPE